MNIYDVYINNVAATKCRVIARNPEEAKKGLLKYHKEVLGLTFDTEIFITVEFLCEVKEGVVLY